MIMELQYLNKKKVAENWFFDIFACPCGTGTVEEHYLDFGIKCKEIWILCPSCKKQYIVQRQAPDKCELYSIKNNELITLSAPKEDTDIIKATNNDHIYAKEDLTDRFEAILNKTLGEIDNLSLFEHVQQFDSQKGIAGTIIEQCVLKYPPDQKQKADLIVIDGNNRVPTELKTTGLRISNDDNGKHFVAKEPMSITAVGIYDIADQTFHTSHFWEKIQHLLIVYYHYLANTSVPPAEYAPFPIKGYEFHEFSADDIETLMHDWNIVRDFCENIIHAHPGNRDKAWKKTVKQDYIERHGALRRDLSFIELVPCYPPRFRLKQPFVNSIVSDHFGYKLEQLPGRYTTITDIDRRCNELQQEYAGRTIGELAALFNVPTTTNTGKENKNIAEQVIVRMFGGNSKKLNSIKLFQQYGLIAKTITRTPSGEKTEDMKLFQIDFEEIVREIYYDEDGTCRPFEFEDSTLYNYFTEHTFLCILFTEPEKEYTFNPITHQKQKVNHPLAMNKFDGFKRLVFTDTFIDTIVRKCWEDTRSKILNHTLVDVIQRKSDGTTIYLKNGDISSAPNFIKSTQNAVFIRGSGTDSSSSNKTEIVNDIQMLPQYFWLKGQAVIKEL